jgi:hypothetical protein
MVENEIPVQRDQRRFDPGAFSVRKTEQRVLVFRLCGPGVPGFYLFSSWFSTSSRVSQVLLQDLPDVLE